MSEAIGWLEPQWPAPASVRAGCTLRTGGVSAPPFDTLNLGAHVGDAPSAVAENRRRLREALRLPAEPAWLEQVHGASVVPLEAGRPRRTLRADAACTRDRGQVCAVQVADCLPVLLADREGSAVAAAHAGWRGLAAGVIEATVEALALPPARLLAWLGPAIGPGHFEVGGEVREAMLAADPGAGVGFAVNARGRWQCDLQLLARRRLERLGIHSICGGGWCVYGDSARFFSYRRTGRCGRMAALIWLEPGRGG